LGEKSPNLPHNIHFFELVSAKPKFKLFKIPSRFNPQVIVVLI
jgi:hypothetical protein